MRTTIDPAARRRFGLLDAMILVVAAAVGLAWLRERSWEVVYGVFIGTAPSPFFARVMSARTWFHAAIPVLVPLTCAAVAFRLRRPRPSLRRVMCQPGPVGCLAAASAFALFLAKHGIGRAFEAAFPAAPAFPGVLDDWEPWVGGLDGTAGFAGAAVLGAWLTLALGGRWRPEAGWVDRFGRVMGLAWIASVPLQMAIEILWPLGMAGRV